MTMPAGPFVLVDRYDVTEEIGRGGHAVVFRAFDRVLSRDVAVKLLKADAMEADTLTRFEQEVQVTAQLEHAHILHVYDTGSYEGRPFVVMELAPGKTLAERMEHEGQLPIADALQIARDVGLALAHAHTRGVVHRDVKPENILLGTGGAILADFGIARVTTDGIVRRITSTGMAVGTVQYMSPEQLCAEPHIDGRSDQYSLACVLYEMLAGVRPHIAATAEGLRLLRMTERQVPVSAHRPAVPEHIVEALQIALRAMSADRFRGMEEFLLALGLSASGEYAAGGSGAHAALLTRRSGEAAVVARREGATTATWWTGPRAAIAAMLLAMVAVSAFVFRPVRSASAIRVGALPIVLTLSPDTSVHVGRVMQAIRAELSAWPAVQLLDARARERPGLQVRASLSALGDSSRIGLEVIDPANPTARRHDVWLPTAQLDSTGTRSEAVARLVRQMLSVAGPQLAPGSETVPDRSLPALTAYVDGFSAMRRGELAVASAHFRVAREASLRFALAAFWAAQSSAWATPNEVALWRADIDAVVRMHVLRGVDSLLAVGLQQLAARDFVAACLAYRAAASADPASFTAWYGLGTCQRIDPVVVTTKTGLAFRSSHWGALGAYSKAVEVAPSAEWLAALFGPIRQVTYAEGGRLRSGVGETDQREYQALPDLMNDSLAFSPLPREAVEAAAAGTVPLSWQRALRRGRDVLLDITSRWTTNAPLSVDAWMERATALEISGKIDQGTSGFSSDDALNRAEALSTSPAVSARLTIARMRLALRRGDMATAMRLGQGSVRGNATNDTTARSARAAVAAFIGDAATAELLSRSLDTDFPGLPPVVADLLHHVNSSAAQGSCAGLESNVRQLEALFRSTLPANELGEQRTRWLRPVYRIAAPCLGTQMNGGFPPEAPLERAFAALVRGNREEARRVIRTAQAVRDGASVSSVSWDYLYLESWTLAQAGDTLAARTLLLGALEDIAGMSRYTLDYVPPAAGLRRSLLLLRNLYGADAAVSAPGKAERTWLQQAMIVEQFKPRQ